MTCFPGEATTNKSEHQRRGPDTSQGMTVRRKDRQLAGNGGQWATYARAEATVDIDHLWGADAVAPDDLSELDGLDSGLDPAAFTAPAGPVAETPEVAPAEPARECETCHGRGAHENERTGKRTECVVCTGTGTFPDVIPLTVGTDSGLVGPGRYVGQKQPILVTEHNADLLALLTQDDIDSRSTLWYDLRDVERDRVARAVTAEDVTLPADPTPTQIAAVAANIDRAFTGQTAYLSGDKHDSIATLRDVYGTPDRALVAVGAAVAAHADTLADGLAHGGAAETVDRWNDRRTRIEVAERANASGETFHRSALLVDIDAGRDQQTRKALADMADAYTAALAQVRPMGGAVVVVDGSSKPGAAVVASTAHLWPSDWIAASNDCEVPLHVGESVKRAHYRHQHSNAITKRGQGEAYIEHLDAEEESASNPQGLWHLTRVPHFDADGNPLPRTRRVKGDRHSTYLEYEPLTPAEQAERGFTPGAKSYRVVEWEYRDVTRADAERRDFVRRIAEKVMQPYEREQVAELAATDLAKAEDLVHERINNTPGWKSDRYGIGAGSEVVVDERINDGKPFYRQPKMRRNELPSPEVSTIKLSKTPSVGPNGRDARYPAAVHELGHRMEYLVPNLNEMTRTWRSRRVDESPTAEGQQLRSIYGGTREVGYTDEFVDHYVGKTYDKRTESPFHTHPRGVAETFHGATEVFSMGAEAVFSGTEGGLIGLSTKKRADTDMRDFILGVFATAGAHKG